jgi:hypothetical protein
MAAIHVRQSAVMVCAGCGAVLPLPAQPAGAWRAEHAKCPEPAATPRPKPRRMFVVPRR